MREGTREGRTEEMREGEIDVVFNFVLPGTHFLYKAPAPSNSFSYELINLINALVVDLVSTLMIQSLSTVTHQLGTKAFNTSLRGGVFYLNHDI